ncbi:MAG: PilT/PilU family type 4a pilus ATPase [Candidatus Eremiobacterota bacterium]
MRLNAFDFDALLSSLEGLGASDLFLRPGMPPALRVRGGVFPMEAEPVPAAALEALVERILSPTARERYAADGDLDVGYSPPQGGRFRLNFHRQMGRPALAARSLPSGSLTLPELNLPMSLGQFAEVQRGLVLVTGPTGAGKSTTLAALIHLINSNRQCHIVTIEDPVEFVHRDLLAVVTQRELGTDSPSFSHALRNILRESPDVILIGELRDRESAEVAIQAALTGHLVLASLHTADAAQSLQRLLSMFPERRSSVAADLSMGLVGIVSQRLLPRADVPGLIPAVELLTVSPAVRRLIQQDRVEEVPDLMRSSEDPRTHTFNHSLLELLQRGVIDYDSGLNASPNPDEFRLGVLGMETGVTAFRKLEAEAANVLDLGSLLDIAVERKASDLHLSVGRPPMLRVDGVLERLPMDKLTAGDVRWLLFSVLSQRQQSMYELDKELDFSLTTRRGHRFRVSAYHQKGHSAVAIRAVPSRIPTVEELGLPPALVDLSERPQGLILTVGPTGSGKSTTTACLVNRINESRPCHIITVEDPVEYSHDSLRAIVDQREVYSDTQSFARALKYVLREDPDVIVVGEMRDLETISAALTAAETGHLVFATLHTNDVAQTVDRIVDVFPPYQQKQIRIQLAACLLGVSSQRLLRRADGTGRVAAFELMLANPAVRALVREGKTHLIPNVVSTSMDEGMTTLDHSLARLFQSGTIAREEALIYLTQTELLDTPVVPVPEYSQSR